VGIGLCGEHILELYNVNVYLTRLFPESFVSDIPAWDGKTANLFYSVCTLCSVQ
jgi:hypothetical protein